MCFVNQTCAANGSGCVDATTSSAAACFPGDATLEVWGRGAAVRMDEVRVGDVVRVATGEFEPVLFFSRHWHGSGGSGPGGWAKQRRVADAEMEIEVVVLEAVNGDEVALSPEHLAIVANRGEVPARDVRVGDVVSSGKVVSVRRETRVGAYSPVTKSLTLLVDGVAVSALTTASPARFVVQMGVNLLAMAHALLPLELYGALVDAVDVGVGLASSAVRVGASHAS